jgi:hypothetical protein
VAACHTPTMSWTARIGIAASCLWGAGALAQEVAEEAPGEAPAYAVLHVGVHGDAGTEYDIAADGAAGQCDVRHARVICPAEGPVHFRWGPSEPDGWVLIGGTTVNPGQTGVAFVLIDDDLRTEEIQALSLDRATPEIVRDLFFDTSDHAIEPPSMGMLQALFELRNHKDPMVRRQLIDVLSPWWRHTASDPMSADAPQLIPPGMVMQMALDDDKAVARRLANRLRDVNMPGEPLQAEAQQALHFLASRPDSMRPATASLALLSRAGRSNIEESWIAALEGVVTPGPRGRSSANALGRLASVATPSDVVDPERAVALVFQHHRERTWNVWFAWREHVPFDAERLAVLLRDTVGAHRGLIKYFGENNPEALAEVLARWEPAEPHSTRWALVTAPLGEIENPALQALFPEDPDEDQD